MLGLCPRLSDRRVDAWSLRMNQRALVSSNPRPPLGPTPRLLSWCRAGEGRGNLRTSGRVSQASLMSSRPGRSQPKPVPPDEDRGLAEGCSTPVPNLREVPGSPKCRLSLSWSVEAPRWPPETPSPVASIRPLSVPLETSAAPPPRPRERPAAGCSQRAGEPFVEAVLLCRVLCFCRAGLFSAEASGMFNVSAGRVHAGVGVVRQRWAPLHSGGDGAPVFSQVLT